MRWPKNFAIPPFTKIDLTKIPTVEYLPKIIELLDMGETSLQKVIF